MKYPHLAHRVFNVPLLIHPDKLTAIVAGLGNRLLGGEAQSAADALAQHLRARPEQAAQADEGATHAPSRSWLFTTRGGERRTGSSAESYYEVHQDVAVVSAMGILAHRTRMEADSSMVLGYQQIVRNVTAAVEDDDIRRVVLLLDSPGGEVSGAFEAAATLRELSSRKPITALVDTLAASAGYLLASAATSRVIAPTGQAGSIGVVMQHVDFSRALANDGIGITHIFAGRHKVDGNPYAPLPESVRADFQAEIDELYLLFVRTVAEHTGLSPEAIRATEARMYRAQAAVDVGLADRVGTADATLIELLEKRPAAVPVGQPARATVSTGAHAMTDKRKMADEPNEPANNEPANDEALAAARAEGYAEGYEKGYAEGYEKGRTEGADEGETQGEEAAAKRISAILGSPEAKGREQLANHLAFSGMTVKAAVAALAQAPMASGLGTLPSLARAGGHDLGPNGEPGGDDATALAQQVLSAFRGTRQ